MPELEPPDMLPPPDRLDLADPDIADALKALAALYPSTFEMLLLSARAGNPAA
jgi:hypothetical protein